MVEDKKKQIKRGSEALSSYYREMIDGTLDKLSSEGKLNNEDNLGVAKQYLEFVYGVANASGKERVELLNHNQFTDYLAGTLESFVNENKEPLAKELFFVEDELDLSFKDLGYTEEFLDKSFNVMKDEGFLGKKGFLTFFTDALMVNIDILAEKIYSDFKEDGLIREDADLMLKFASDVFGINMPGIQEAYFKGGFIGEKTGNWLQEGVAKYFMDQLVENGSQFLEPQLQMLPMLGFQHNLSAEGLKETYAKNGIFKKDGLLQSAIMDIYTNTSEADNKLYIIVAQSMVQQHVLLKFKDWDMKNPPEHFASAEARALAKNDYITDLQYEANRLMDGVLQRGTPKSLDVEKIKEIYDTAEGGFFGSDGVLMHLFQNIDDLFGPFVEEGLVNDGGLKNGSPMKFDFKGVPVDFELDWEDANNIVSLGSFYNLAYNLAEKADEMGVEPGSLLRDKSYQDSLGEVYRATYGDDLKPLEQVVKSLKTSVFLSGIQNELKDPEVEKEFLYSVDDLKASDDLGDRLLAKFAEPLAREGVLKDVRDYLTMIEAASDKFSMHCSAVVENYSA